MLIIWLLLRNANSFATGPLVRYLTFVCARCGHSLPASVQYMGHASGSSHFAAQQAAYAAAEANAYQSLAAAACPGCGQLHPNVVAQRELLAQRAARAAKRRLPIALALAAVVFVLVAIPAVGDIRESLLLAVVAICASVAVGGFVLGLLSGRSVGPTSEPRGVWFSTDPAGSAGSWFAARPGPAAEVVQPPAGLQIVSLLSAGGAAIAAFVALGFWVATFDKVYVVNTNLAGDAVVEVDGTAKATVSTIVPSNRDIGFATVEVRTNRKHRIVVRHEVDGETAFEIDPTDGSPKAWILAAKPVERSLCLLPETWYYGQKPPAESDDHLLKPTAEGVYRLEKSVSLYFEKPPSTIRTESSSGETRVALRALDCAALAAGHGEEETLIPWSQGPSARKPSSFNP